MVKLLIDSSNPATASYWLLVLGGHWSTGTGHPRVGVHVIDSR